jgi:hypothetical protein
MSINRYAARVDSNQAEIVEALRAAGASVWVLGLPLDLLVGVPKKDGNGGATVLMEVKVLVGKKNPRPKDHTPLQRDFLDSWRGGPVATVTDVEGAMRVLRVMEAAEQVGGMFKAEVTPCES